MKIYVLFLKTLVHLVNLNSSPCWSRQSDVVYVLDETGSNKNLPSVKLSGEVSDSESNSSSSSSDSDSSEDDVFRDGYDDDLMGDAEDRARLEQMTEKEREQELFNRIEKREVLKRRSVDTN